MIQSLGSYDSCGSAGNKYCTFGFNDPAKDVQEPCRRSLNPVLCGASPQAESNGCSGEQNHCNTPENSETNHCSAPEKGSDANLCGSAKEGGETNGCNTPKES